MSRTVGRPSHYPWEDWFQSKKTVTLRKKDYNAAQQSMVVMIRERSKDRGVRVSVVPKDNGVIKIIPRGANIKYDLYQDGVDLVDKFCAANGIEPPEIEEINPGDRLYEGIQACGWYRKGTISIAPAKCAFLGRGGPYWSWPGYVIDRTPYGVMAHELGHHVDLLNADKKKGSYSSDFSQKIMEESKETKLTNYCPNPAEWFAEMFRLFLTNPHLLSKLRPETYQLLLSYFAPVEKRTWKQVLSKAPKRTIQQAQKKIKDAS